MQKESVISTIREYLWMLEAREIQRVLMQIIMKGQMRLAKITLALSDGVQRKIFANISKGASEDLRKEIEILRPKVTLEQQEEAAAFALDIIKEMIDKLEVHLPEMLSSMAYIDGESPMLFKDELISSRRILESWILITDKERLADILASAKAQMTGRYLDALESLSRDVRKYLLPYLVKEDYEVMVNSFTKETFNTLRSTQSITARAALISHFERASAKVVYQRRDFVYQGAIQEPLWWQARLQWEEIFRKLDDLCLINVLMSATIEEVMLAHYESSLVIRERLFTLFGKEIGGILRYVYREMDFERLGDKAYQVRLTLIKEAAKVEKIEGK